MYVASAGKAGRSQLPQPRGEGASAAHCRGAVGSGVNQDPVLLRVKPGRGVPEAEQVVDPEGGESGWQRGPAVSCPGLRLGRVDRQAEAGEFFWDHLCRCSGMPWWCVDHDVVQVGKHPALRGELLEPSDLAQGPGHGDSEEGRRQRAALVYPAGRQDGLSAVVVVPEQVRRLPSDPGVCCLE